MEKYSIGQFSKKTATTIRTLHYYDELGLLKPSYVTEKGRRYYMDKDLATLQRIVTFKYLGYTLEQIKGFFQQKTWDLKDTLSFQKREMVQKKEQLENVIKVLDHALYVLEDQTEVEPSIFINIIQNVQMEREHKEWFKEILDEDCVEEIYDISESRQREIDKQWITIVTELKKINGLDPEDERVQKLIAELMEIVNELTGDDLGFVQELAGAELKDEPWLFHSPFTPEEEEWLSLAFHVYLQGKGVEIDHDPRTKK